jgi:transcriptional regulator with XRE-family HTH domain
MREESGYTLKTAGHRLERSASSLSIIEKGMQSLRLRDLRHILDTYGAPPDLHQALMTLAEQEQHPGWWNDFKDLVTHQDRDYASLERDAAQLHGVETRFIPGLLQTEDYARAIAHSDPGERDANRTERFVAFRMGRQAILRSPHPPSMRMVLDEAALRRPWGGPDVMRIQLGSLLEKSHEDYVDLQVLPLSCAAESQVSGNFWLLDIGDPPIFSSILVDHIAGRWILEDEEDLRRYRKAFTRASSVALGESGTRALIEQIISEL